MIRVVGKPNEQYKYNVGRVIEGLRSQIRLWTSLPLSTMGAVAIAKMIFLPRCLYTVQNLLCLLPQEMFQTFNSLLIALVWVGRRS